MVYAKSLAMLNTSSLCLTDQQASDSATHFKRKSLERVSKGKKVQYIKYRLADYIMYRSAKDCSWLKQTKNQNTTVSLEPLP